MSGGEQSEGLCSDAFVVFENNRWLHRVVFVSQEKHRAIALRWLSPAPCQQYLKENRQCYSVLRTPYRGSPMIEVSDEQVR